MQRNEKITYALKGGSDEDNMPVPDIEDTLRQSQIEIMDENKNLQCLNTSLHERYHTISLKLKELQDTLTGKETEAAELHNQIDDLQYELGKVRLRNDKLENHLAEAIEKLKTYHQMHGDQQAKPVSGSSTSKPTNTTNVATQHLEDLQKEVEEYRELANNRLQELDKLHQTHRETLKEVEKLKMDVSTQQSNLKSFLKIERCLKLPQINHTEDAFRAANMVHSATFENVYHIFP